MCFCDGEKGGGIKKINKIKKKENKKKNILVKNMDYCVCIQESINTADSINQLCAVYEEKHKSVQCMLR